MLKDIFCSPCIEHGIEIKTKRLSPIEVIEEVSKFRNVDFNSVIGKRRDRHLVDARHIAMHLLRHDRYLNLSLKVIGNYFNGRDHTTVIHGLENIRNICFTNSDFKEQLKDCYLQVYKSLKYYNEK